MKNTSEILKRLEEHKGRKLNLSDPRDRARFFCALDREFNALESILKNIKNALNGFNTYDPKEHETRRIPTNKK